MGVIYKITNKANGKIYVGKTISGASVRWNSHRHCYKTHKDFVLYRAMRKYGIENFFMEVIDEVDDDDELNTREVYWIAALRCTDSKIGYNCTTGGEGHRHTPESRARMCGKIVSEETRKKLSQKVFTPEYRAKLSASSKAYYQTVPPEIRSAKAKMAAQANADKMRGKKRDPAIVAKVVAANKGRIRRPEEVYRLKTVNIGRKQSPEEIERRRESNRKTWAVKSLEERLAHGAKTLSMYMSKRLEAEECGDGRKRRGYQHGCDSTGAG